MGISSISGPAAPVGLDRSYQDEGLNDFRNAFLKMVNRDRIQKSSVSTTIPSDGELIGNTFISSGLGKIVPPFSFHSLATIVENSSALSSNIGAMVTNIDGFGHMLDPVVNFNNPNVNDQVRDILLRQRIDELGPFTDLMSKQAIDAIKEAEPTIEEIVQTKKIWKRISSVEKSRAESFFKFVNPTMSFVALRRKTRKELETFGNAAWEIIREDPEDINSRISQIHFVPFIGVSLIQTSPKPQETTVVIKKDTVSFEKIQIHTYFRSFVREIGQIKTYYKEFGDPRVMSRFTGRYYKDVDELLKEEPQPEGSPVPTANELQHWKIDSPLTPYGVPRWISAAISALGSRASEEVNFLYFDNKAMPPMIMMVSGGRLTEGSVNKIESYIEDRVKGRENFHSIMVIEAIPANTNSLQDDVKYDGKMKIELRPLVNDSIKDALFQEYDNNNQLKIGRSFRQSPIITGDTKDVNRSTAKIAKAMAEEQVYQPERDFFDVWVDNKLMSNILVHFWEFKSKASVQRIPSELVDNVVKSLKGGAITPNEARRILSDAFSVDLDYRSEEWAEIPPQLAEASSRNGTMIDGNPTTVAQNPLKDQPTIQNVKEGSDDNKTKTT